MKKLLPLFILFIGMSLILTSCGSTDQAEKTSNKFFSLLIKGKTAEANKLVETSFNPDSQLAEVQKLAENDENGKLLSARKTMGFNTNISNGITTVILPYELKFKKTEINVQVTLVDRGSGFKIQSVN